MSSPPAPKRIKLEEIEPIVPPEDSLHPDSPSDDEDRCSICLQSILDRTLVPICSHEFCFECLLVWTAQSRRCPLCSQAIGAFLIHNIRSRYDYQKHFLTALPTSPRPDLPAPIPLLPLRGHNRRRPRGHCEWGRNEHTERAEADRFDRALAKRRWVYAHELYAKHVASNAYTRYRPYPTPTQFAASPELISRTTMFLRRELQVWVNLDVEFLTTFTLSIMKALDIRSEGALKLLAEFLDLDAEGGGRKKAEHFAHELYTFVRSPYKDLFVYDEVVQYDKPDPSVLPSTSSSARRWDRSRSRSRSRSPRPSPQRRVSRSRSPNRVPTPPRARGRLQSRSRSRSPRAPMHTGSPPRCRSQSRYDRRSRSRSRSRSRDGNDYASRRSSSRSRSRSESLHAGTRDAGEDGNTPPVEMDVDVNEPSDAKGKGKARAKSRPLSPLTAALDENHSGPAEREREREREPLRAPRRRTLFESVQAHLNLNLPVAAGGGGGGRRKATATADGEGGETRTRTANPKSRDAADRQSEEEGEEMEEDRPPALLARLSSPGRDKPVSQQAGGSGSGADKSMGPKLGQGKNERLSTRLEEARAGALSGAAVTATPSQSPSQRRNGKDQLLRRLEEERALSGRVTGPGPTVGKEEDKDKKKEALRRKLEDARLEAGSAGGNVGSSATKDRDRDRQEALRRRLEVARREVSGVGAEVAGGQGGREEAADLEAEARLRRKAQVRVRLAAEKRTRVGA